MRILHFYKTYYPDSTGGTAQFINQLARASLNLGIKSDVLSLSAQKDPSVRNIHGHYGYRAKTTFQIASTGFSIDAFSQFAKLAQQSDIIHYHFPWPFMDMIHLSLRVKKPTVVTYHSDIVRQKTLLKVYRPLKHQFLSSVDRIVATSPNYLNTSPVLNQFRNKTSVIPIGINKSTYPSASQSRVDFWHEQFGPRFFLFVGVFRYYKGLHILIEALKHHDYPMVIVGAGPEESLLKKQAATLGLKNIHFPGALPDEDKIALLQACYAVVFPSHLRSEAFGISLLEGAMFGKPLISCEIGTGTSFINIDNETGLVVEPNNPEALRDAMTVLWNDPEQAKAMGINAEQRYWKLFTADNMAKCYQTLYQKLIEEKCSLTV